MPRPLHVLLQSPLSSSPASAGQARELARELLADRLPTAILDDLLVMTSELVTNAVLHGDGPIEMVIGELNDAVVVGVSDGLPSADPVVRPWAPEPALGGMGMRIVESMSHRWGVTRNAASKTVWFMVASDRVS